MASTVWARRVFAVLLPVLNFPCHFWKNIHGLSGLPARGSGQRGISAGGE